MASALEDPALPATGASQQDIRGIGRVKQC